MRSNRPAARLERPASRGEHEYGLPIETVDTSVRATAKRYHWGIPPTQVIKWDDSDFPDVHEMGRLCEVHILPFGARGNPAKKPLVMPIPKRWWDDFPEGKLAVIAQQTPKARKPQAHVAFDKEHKYQRIYLCLPNELQRDFRGLFRRDTSIDLNVLSDQAGGRQAMQDYPHIMVSPVGVFAHIVYYTAKGGDDDNPGGDPRSQYIHEFGEETGIRPWLAVDVRGRLWLAGGDYKVLVAGIAN